MDGENATAPQVSSGQNYAIPFAIVVAGLAIAGAVYFGDGKKGIFPAVAAQPIGTVEPVTPDDHILGNPDAKVVIVEYSDTECPYCKLFHPTMQRIMNEYGKDGKVAWVYRHLIVVPQHTKAAKEAQALECANKLGNNIKFWEYSNNLFEITPGNNQLDPAELPKIANNIGLDVTAFNKCLEGDEMKAIVDKNLEKNRIFAQNGTPFSIILVNKKPVDSIQGAQPYEAVKAQIEALLK
ncbi:MAG: thioredoxin domain-containing protein [Candidatus Yonathbacteria bacterium]|nr:thioredoxin domain-containing protein [Candidatus Yonathbacteria bacterium]